LEADVHISRAADIDERLEYIEHYRIRLIAFVVGNPEPGFFDDTPIIPSWK
jgi:hypothetical protein